jgi:integrase/recombinase XerC
MAAFLASLAHDDLAPTTLRGYRYDLRHFLAWHRTVQHRPFTLEGLAEFELIAYRQYMVAAGRRPAAVNRRLDALRRLCRWARGTGALSADAAGSVRPMRTVRNRQPVGLADIEIHALLRAAGASSHGLAARNYALVQLMLQAGLRVGEVAALQIADISISDRSGSVRIRQGKGLKAREVPLNATARRAVKQHLKHRQASSKSAAGAHDPSRDHKPGPPRPAHARTRLGAHATPYLRARLSAQQPRQAAGAGQPARPRLDTTVVYTRPSRDDLAVDLERSHLNVDG